MSVPIWFAELVLKNIRSVILRCCYWKDKANRCMFIVKGYCRTNAVTAPAKRLTVIESSRDGCDSGLLVTYRQAE